MSGCLSWGARGDVEGTSPGWAEGLPAGCLESDPRSLPASRSFPWLCLMVEKKGFRRFPTVQKSPSEEHFGLFNGQFPPNPPLA